MTNRNFVKYILPIVLWMVLIFVSSSIPEAFFPNVDFWVWGKLVHVIYFGVLALLIQRALTRQTRHRILWKYVQFVSIFAAVCYGASDEIHQLFTVGRHARIGDVLIDGFGASLFIVASMALRTFVHDRVEDRKEVL
jgi:VanZ family protein